MMCIALIGLLSLQSGAMGKPHLRGMTAQARASSSRSIAQTAASSTATGEAPTEARTIRGREEVEV